MKIAGIVFGVLFLGLLAVAGFSAMYVMKLSNIDAGFRAKHTALTSSAKVSYDNMWKEVSEKAQIATEYKDAFNEALIQSMEARYGGEDRQSPLFKFINEQNPTLDPSLFKDIMATVTVQRAVFKQAQEELISLKQQHDLLMTTLPDSWILSMMGKKKMDITLILSDKTDNAYKTGKDDAINIFNKKQPAEK